MLRLARVAAATTALAIRRLRHRWGIACASAAAIAVAVGLLCAVSLVAARSGESAQRAEVGRWSPRARLVQMTVRRDERETAAQTLRDAARRFAPFARLLGRPASMVVAGPVSPADENGVRIVTFAGATLVAGRLPRTCDAARCEVAAVGRRPAVGSRLALGSARARIVGRVALPAAVRPPEAILRGRAVLAPSLAMLTGPAASASASAVLSASVRPGIFDARDAGTAARELRAEAARAERGRLGVAVRAPVAALNDLDRRIRTARHRLVLIGAQAAALLVAFLALLGSAFRRDAEVLDDQLAALGAYRWQATAGRALEVAVPALAGAAAALGSAALAAGALGVALPAETFALAGVLLAVSVVASLVAARDRPQARRVRAIDVAALGSLALIAWQAVATGGLDTAQVADDAALPVLLLVPTLAVFAGAVVVSRALPLAFRGAERLARRRRMGARLALLSLARGGGIAAAATTFLAVALGTALFALNYRATLAGQLEDSAAFAAGAPSRVVAPVGRTVAPLDRFAAKPARVMRFAAHLTLAGAEEAPVDGTLLALPAADLPAVSGWRPDFSADSRSAIASRLAAGAGAFHGPGLDGDAVRLWARSSIAGTLVLELLEPGETFARVELGPVDDGWRLLRARLPRRARRSQIAGLTLSSGVSTAGAQVELGPLSRHGAGGWAVLDRLESWTVSTGRPGEQFPPLPAGFVHAPISRGVRIELGGGSVPLLRPSYPVPPEIPALVSDELAARAVDGRLSASVLGWPLRLRVVARARLFPTVVHGARQFAVVDYDTLFATLTADRPGDGVAREAWFFGGAAPGAPLRPGERLLTHRQLDVSARRDALATGASTLLLVTAALAVVLATAGLLLTAATAVRAEGGELASWLALGAAPGTLAASVRLRILLLYAAGTVAAAIGALLALRLVAALVAVAAGGRAALPPILARVDWAGSALLVVLTGAATAVVAVRLARVTTRRLRARRLRA